MNSELDVKIKIFNIRNKGKYIGISKNAWDIIVKVKSTEKVNKFLEKINEEFIDKDNDEETNSCIINITDLFVKKYCLKKCPPKFSVWLKNMKFDNLYKLLNLKESILYICVDIPTYGDSWTIKDGIAYSINYKEQRHFDDPHIHAFIGSRSYRINVITEEIKGKELKQSERKKIIKHIRKNRNLILQMWKLAINEKPIKKFIDEISI